MSTLAEIEAAIESLPEPQIEALAVWLQQRDGARIQIEKKDARPGSVRDFIGSFNSGAAHGADNSRIDADLAAEAAGGL